MTTTTQCPPCARTQDTTRDVQELSLSSAPTFAWDPKDVVTGGVQYERICARHRLRIYFRSGRHRRNDERPEGRR